MFKILTKEDWQEIIDTKNLGRIIEIEEDFPVDMYEKCQTKSLDLKDFEANTTTLYVENPNTGYIESYRFSLFGLTNFTKNNKQVKTENTTNTNLYSFNSVDQQFVSDINLEYAKHMSIKDQIKIFSDTYMFYINQVTEQLRNQVRHSFSLLVISGLTQLTEEEKIQARKIFEDEIKEMSHTIQIYSQHLNKYNTWINSSTNQNQVSSSRILS